MADELDSLEKEAFGLKQQLSSIKISIVTSH